MTEPRKLGLFIAGIVSMVLALTALALAFGGCTVAPQPVAPPAAPAFSGNSQDGGVLDLGPNNKGPARVDAEWVLAYDFLIRTYGKDFTPPLKADDGVIERADGTFSVDLEHLADKNVMASLKRSEIAP